MQAKIRSPNGVSPKRQTVDYTGLLQLSRAYKYSLSCRDQVRILVGNKQKVMNSEAICKHREYEYFLCLHMRAFVFQFIDCSRYKPTTDVRCHAIVIA